MGMDLIKLVDTVEQIRLEKGACTLGIIAERLGISRPGAHAQVRKAIKNRLLTMSDVTGSIRLPSLADQAIIDNDRRRAIAEELAELEARTVPEVEEVEVIESPEPPVGVPVRPPPLMLPVRTRGSWWAR